MKVFTRQANSYRSRIVMNFLDYPRRFFTLPLVVYSPKVVLLAFSK